MKNAHVFAPTYERMGIDLRNLGCLMLKTESPFHDGLTGVEDAEYYSPDPKKFWIKGLLDNWHVTVRYGFLNGVTADDVDAVVAEAKIPTTLSIAGTDIFESPYPYEKYSCLVARVDDESLNELNQALSVLPNVNTFPVYKAHITIGYFKQGEIPSFDLKHEVDSMGFDYGRNLPRLESK